ncbi:MAG: SoxR reducing system RseC family protein, partial [Pseudogulbenkiania sp.]|nr:SoxR reducing system RseC family protein [Pseudogulbenkiania sp.]
VFSHGEARFRAHNPLGAQAGDWVSVPVPEQGVLKSALLMYLAPLAGLFAGAALGALVNELASVLAGGLGFVITLLAVRRFARRYRHAALFHPTITARYPSEPFTMEKTCRSKS